MSRPAVRRALKRAGLSPAPKEFVETPGIPPPPRISLPGEPPGTATPVDWEAFFGRTAPVEIEIGSGRGRFLTDEAALRPGTSFLGAEIEVEYARIAQARADRMGLTNVRFARLDGKAFVLSRVPEGSLAALHVFFPDPWPKKRHAKRRLFEPDFVRAATLALVPGGRLRVATDNLPYFAALREVLDAEPALEKVPGSEEGWSSGTDYERKYEKEGRPMARGIWRRRAAG
ncbi:MAG: tRNA (guanosine(46)-N7)-methyltransferase TrmB [Thermoanaerobaculia bacterium]|nr:tRNA (guanosine(46)-N7)-methyltransferase TrmB [Thermoanaerobaculia bacterium]